MTFTSHSDSPAAEVWNLPLQVLKAICCFCLRHLVRLLASVSLRRCQPAKASKCTLLRKPSLTQLKQGERKWGDSGVGRLRGGEVELLERDRECLSACVRVGERAFTSACLLSWASEKFIDHWPSPSFFLTGNGVIRPQWIIDIKMPPAIGVQKEKKAKQSEPPPVSCTESLTKDAPKDKTLPHISASRCI